MARPDASEGMLDRRKLVEFQAEKIRQVQTNEYPQYFPGESDEWTVAKFKDQLQIKIHESAPFDSTFSVIGVDASVANAFRRILLAEVPSLCIENVYIHNNTSIIQDEVLAQRLGLIPLQANPEGLRWMKWVKKATSGETESRLSDYNTVILELKVECTWKEDGKQLYRQGENDPKKLYNNSNVYAHQMRFINTGRQEDFFKEEEGTQVKSVNPDILVAKLRPGQVIDLEMHCNKGIGADHAKFSPVATASYRLLPQIDILKPILGDAARKFQRCFPRGVIDLRPVTKAESQEKDGMYAGMEGQVRPIVADPMRDTVSREVLRHDEFKDKVRLGRVRDHFIFRVESVGQYESEELFIESVKLLKAKCARMRRSLGELNGLGS